MNIFIILPVPSLKNLDFDDALSGTVGCVNMVRKQSIRTTKLVSQ